MSIRQNCSAWFRKHSFSFCSLWVLLNFWNGHLARRGEDCWWHDSIFADDASVNDVRKGGQVVCVFHNLTRSDPSGLYSVSPPSWTSTPSGTKRRKRLNGLKVLWVKNAQCWDVSWSLGNWIWEKKFKIFVEFSFMFPLMNLFKSQV